MTSLHRRTCGEDIFRGVMSVLSNLKIEWSKISRIAVDGAQSVVGIKSGFIARLLSNLQGLEISRDGFNHGKLKSFFKNIEAEYSDISYHADIQWLSRGLFLKLFVDFKDKNYKFLYSRVQDLSVFSDRE
ncbi:hypothetical protein RF11_10162 [Thelohanellus kitauei]|uniref:General transcription factor II-I repeat domain-containing protein 2A n=1 Tax=Thelohanellus kitauei TaxID=669202 RepID=A0A0C2MFV5_THEKT|nr:hypothetical protein RF11_09355 [Thelohanellus kitauei]KII66056.1 hypothetical protein RF11_10162 [Thelohanellus kitauei]